MIPARVSADTMLMMLICMADGVIAAVHCMVADTFCMDWQLIELDMIVDELTALVGQYFCIEIVSVVLNGIMIGGTTVTSMPADDE